MKKNKISKNWINKQKKDFYVRRSKIDGYRSRAAYKLLEIDEKFKIFKNRKLVIDLGSAPGSWSQYSLKKVKKGTIISIDLKKMEKINGIMQVEGDFKDEKTKVKIINLMKSKADLILSDMAVNTTGNKDIDSIYTCELCKEAMLFSKEMLNKDGNFVSKIFMGSTFNEILLEAKSIFKYIKVFKPKSSRKDSKESFIICKNLRSGL